MAVTRTGVTYTRGRSNRSSCGERKRRLITGKLSWRQRRIAAMQDARKVPSTQTYCRISHNLDLFAGEPLRSDGTSSISAENVIGGRLNAFRSDSVRETRRIADTPFNQQFRGIGLAPLTPGLDSRQHVRSIQRLPTFQVVSAPAISASAARSSSSLLAFRKHSTWSRLRWPSSSCHEIRQPFQR